jgi:hypothetical protein
MQPQACAALFASLVVKENEKPWNSETITLLRVGIKVVLFLRFARNHLPPGWCTHAAVMGCLHKGGEISPAQCAIFLPINELNYKLPI